MLAWAGTVTTQVFTNISWKAALNTSLATSGNVKHLIWTIIDHYDTTEEKLEEANHIGGVGCRCRECQKLKDVEDKWICRMGTFNPPHGLNTRNALSRKPYSKNGHPTS